MSDLLSTPKRDDCAAIATIVRNQAESWNRADAAAFAERYSEDGSFTNIVGMRVYGKAGFVDVHAQIFRTVFAGSQIAFHIDNVHFIRPDVAVVNIDATLSNLRQAPPGVKLPSDGTLHSRLQEVLSRESDGWQIAAFHNVAIPIAQR